MLNPSDFGFHNAVRQPSGAYAFFDFEYFGWDDPVKATADVVFHAGMALSEELGHLFEKRMIRFWSETDSDFPRRLRTTAPLYGLIWCGIILNEFLPERWERRVLAGGTVDKALILSRQLDKARRLLCRIEERYND